MAKKAVARVGAERELEWYFCCAGSVMGLHAGSLEPGGGALWDASSLERLHLGKLNWSRRRMLGEVQRIEAALEAVSWPQYQTIFLAFAPRPWDPALRSASGTVGENGTLAGLLIAMPEATAQFEERRKRKPKDRTELERHLAEFARTEARGKVFAPLIAAAREELNDAVAAYAKAKVEDANRRREEKRLEIESFRMGLGK